MHHSRRKSGHGSMTDVRKAASTSDSKHKTSSKHGNSSSSSRRTGSSSQPSSKSSKSGSSSRDAEKLRDDDYWYDDERESFPQFCMTCEKQFVAKDDRFLYCSEACRDYDQEHGASVSAKSFKDTYASSRMYYTEAQEPRDIIPRASPSRPSSTYFSLPPTPANMSSTVPATTSSAMAALRSLSLRDASPPSPTLAASSSGIWPFSTRSSATSPSTSYTQPSAVYASTYDQGQGYYRSSGAPNYYTYGAGVSGYLTTERPLPPRRPSSYARPKSIELVTPLLGQ
ncbi:uncharacterized protein SPSK_04383 [Sporothrix schenckii 1099-18]|uniref:Life-span regulatory factor domain-containing protein n=2 Tax=Sporothrix schenckii TaxID=29908 RepID=U7PXZ6_SPOS1|nr:uncharacterized protein SPSK_04383 [Sporothrix schenckii 1099-18]ERS99345.1 hypothetical protein HMPREF1624_04544 [Sporothrix schenckii ATCC 58251]KJR82942.1 hypothetical protein SPSK_04383 [Sporothrix schenckii 1099-18]